MTKEEYKAMITPDVVREIFQSYTVNQDNPRFVISVGGKIIAVGGKIFYDSREQAVRAFYNSFHWRAQSALWRINHPDNPWGWWQNTDRQTVWKAIKEALTESYGFKITQV